MDTALNKWIGHFKNVLVRVEGFERSGRYYYMPRTTLYIRDFTTLKQYMRITKEKRTGSYKFARDIVIFCEYWSFKFSLLAKIPRENIVAPASGDYFSIFAGNHRMRLTSVSFDRDLVVDVTECLPTFNKSSAKVSDSCFSYLAPKQDVTSDDCRVISEERLSGVAINRISPELIKGAETLFLSKYRELALKNVVAVELGFYINSFKTTVTSELNISKLDELANEFCLEDFNRLVFKVCDALASIKVENVMLAPAHRDLNRGNVLACETDELRVIDWEFFGGAYYNYDTFIFLSNYRHSQDLKLSWDRYLKACERMSIEPQPYEVLFFAMEEVIFFLDNYSVRRWKNVRDFKVVNRLLEQSTAIYYACNYDS